MEKFLKTKGLHLRFSKAIPIYVIVATSLLFALCFSPTVYAQYCTPTTTNTGDFTVKFTTTGGSTNANYETNEDGTNPGAYINLSADANYTITQVQGQPLNFEHKYKGGNHHVRIWVDWDNNGTFSNTEEIFYYHYDDGNGPWFGSYTLPLTTDAGSYRMRVRSQYKFLNPNSSLGLTPCGALDYGTTLDFTLVVQEAVACSGTPTPGTANAVPPTANAGTPYSVVATNYSSDLNLTFQWQKYDEVLVDWVNHGTATSTYANLTGEMAPAGIGTEVKYRLKTTCNNSGESNFSSEATFTTGKIYCTPSTEYTSDFTVKFTTTGGSTNANYETNEDGTNPGAYINLSADANYTITQVQGQPLNFEHQYKGGNHHVRIWVDWDNNGTFSNAEEIFYRWNNGNGPWTGTYTLPLTTTPNTYRMRVRSQWKSSAPANSLGLTPCGELDYGTTLDFTFVVQEALPCTGTPVPGTANAVPPIANVGDTYNVVATNYSSDLNLTFQWQKYDEALADWVNHGTATSTYASLTGEIAPAGIGTEVKYRLKTTCNNSGESNFSSEATFKTGKIYCAPTTTNTGDFTVEFTTTGGITNANYTTDVNSPNPGAYINLSADANYTITQVQGQPLNFEHLYTGGSQHFRIWVDWDNNGTFSDDEEIFYQWNSTNGPWSGTYTIPLITPANTYRMRVRSQYKSSNPNSSLGLTPCGELDYGTTLDFTFVVQEALPCTGTPVPGTANAVPPIANVGDTYSVVATNYSSDLNLTFQWQKYDEVLADWVDYGTATSTYASLTGEIAPAGIGTEVKYRLKTTCNNSGEDNESNVATFTTGKVYCAPTTESTGDFTVKFSTTGGITNANYETDVNEANPGAYINLSADANYTVTQTQGQPLNFEHQYKGGSHHVRIWVDWNNNGTFEDAEEIFYHWNNGNGPWTGSPYTIPLTTTPDTYRMRVRSQWKSSAPANSLGLTPCGELDYGTTLDFTLVVEEAAACTGTPAPGTANVVPPTANAGTPYSVVATNFSPATNLAFQWQKYDEAIADWIDYGLSTSTYADLTGEIAPAEVNTEVKYRLKTTCNNSGEVNESNVATFTTVKVYCTPAHTNTLAHTSTFTTTGGSDGASNVNYSASAQTGIQGYDNLSGNANYLISRLPSETVNFSHTYVGGIWPEDNVVRIWVDWNDNGTFEDTERVINDENTGLTKTGEFTVPMGTLAGDYRMRVRSSWVVGVNACESTGLGQALDFTLKVIQCTTDAGEIKGPSAVCQGLNITLTSTETEGTHEWQSKQPSIASIDAISGIVSGLIDGTAEIMYILTTANGCKDTAYHDVTVAEPFTVAITDHPSNDSLLKGTDYTYISSGTSGTWSSTNAFIASVDPTSGKVTALLAGGTDIVYTETHTCSISSLKHLTVYENIDEGGGPEPCPNPPCDINGIDEIDFVSNVSLFPNPASNSVNINFTLNDVSEISISVMDLNGKTIETIAVNNVAIGTNTQTLNVANYANGVYSVVLRSNHSLTTQKLVINK